MKTQDSQINVYSKKVGAGHYEIEVIFEETNEIFKYVETDMQIIDALSEEEGSEWGTQFEAMQFVISKAKKI